MNKDPERKTMGSQHQTSPTSLLGLLLATLAWSDGKVERSSAQLQYQLGDNPLWSAVLQDAINALIQRARCGAVCPKPGSTHEETKRYTWKFPFSPVPLIPTGRSLTPSHHKVGFCRLGDPSSQGRNTFIRELAVK